MMHIQTILLVLFVSLSVAYGQAQRVPLPAKKPRKASMQDQKFYDTKHIIIPSRYTAPDVCTFDSFPSKYVQGRRVDVWLPKGYATSTKRYPVIYLHDGQNVINARHAYGGEEWGLDETLTRLAAEGIGGAAILICIWHTRARFREYQPQAPIELLPEADQRSLAREFGGGPLADAYLRFIVSELKPEIDRQFRTQAEAAHTTIMGSSMGGLISLYAVLEYPKVFSRAACLSTHFLGSLTQIFIPLPAATSAYLEQKLPPPNGAHRFYFDHGTAGLDSLYQPFQQRVDSIFLAKGYKPGPYFQSQVFAGADHRERDWAKRAHIPLTFLLSKQNQKNSTLPSTRGVLSFI